MIRTLRRKFILGSMLSATILIIFLITLILALGYIQMERTADKTLTHLVEESARPMDFLYDPHAMEKRPMFGYEISMARPVQTVYFTVDIDREGNIAAMNLLSVPELDEETVRQLVQAALESGEDEGKIGGYKYRFTANVQGGKRAAFLDNTVQVHLLMQIFTSGCLVGAACLLILFGIVVLVSGHVVRPIAGNMEKQRQFVTNAGHEVKTPVAIIQANAEAMELIYGENKYSRNIKAQCLRLTELIRQLLLLARSDEGIQNAVLEGFDLSALLEERAIEFEALAEQKKVCFSISVSQGLCFFGDRGMVGQLFSILLDNAVHYVNQNERIWVYLTADGTKKQLTVCNTVEKLPNVPPQMLFERFYRGDAARTQSEGGAGLGLSIAQAITSLCHGKIWAEYGPGKQLTFFVEFP